MVSQDALILQHMVLDADMVIAVMVRLSAALALAAIQTSVYVKHLLQ